MWTLSELGDAQAVEPLLIALKDTNHSVRRAAATALGRTRDARAVEPLANALNDANAEVRSAAAAALGQIRHPSAVEALIAALAEHHFDPHVVRWFARRKHWRLRQAAVAALGRAGTAEVIAPLRAALEDTNAEVRDTAAAALRRIEEQVGRLRTDSAEQRRLANCLSQLIAVDETRWAQINGSRYGHLTPGHDTALETLHTDPDQLVQYLIAEQPILRIRWAATASAVVIEYADPATTRLQQRLVVLKQAQSCGYLCYLAWSLAQHAAM
jgi:hypothetical protein